MKPIFQNAHFGDGFLLRDNTIALYIKYDEGNDSHILIDEQATMIEVDDFGRRDEERETDYDIIKKI